MGCVLHVLVSFHYKKNTFNIPKQGLFWGCVLHMVATYTRVCTVHGFSMIYRVELLGTRHAALQRDRKLCPLSERQSYCVHQSRETLFLLINKQNKIVSIYEHLCLTNHVQETDLVESSFNLITIKLVPDPGRIWSRRACVYVGGIFSLTIFLCK